MFKMSVFKASGKELLNRKDIRVKTFRQKWEKRKVWQKTPENPDYPEH